MKTNLAHYLISFRSYIKQRDSWCDGIALRYSKGSEAAVINLSQCFIRFPDVVSRVNILILNFSPTPVPRRRSLRREKAPECSFSRTQMYLALLHFVPREKLLSFQGKTTRRPAASLSLSLGWQSRSCDNQAIPFARAIAYFLSSTVR